MAAKRKTRRLSNGTLDVLRPGPVKTHTESTPEDPVAEPSTKAEVLPELDKASVEKPKKSATPDNYVDQIRLFPAIQAVLLELQKQDKFLRVDKSVVNELERYCSTKALIPEILSADNRETVDKAQQGLQELQARLDRVAAVHLGVRKIQRALQKLETMARHEMAVHGYITTKTSKPSADQLLALVLPELQTHQDAWETFSRICRDVQDHIGSAKEVIRIQMKLDENLHWAQRSGA
jgi:hypothetical protein